MDQHVVLKEFDIGREYLPSLLVKGHGRQNSLEGMERGYQPLDSSRAVLAACSGDGGY